MTQDETIALFLQGREAWNVWAEGMWAEKKRLEEAGLWAAEPLLGDLKEKNAETQAWMAAARADFSSLRFITEALAQAADAAAGNVESILVEADSIDFSAFVFPGQAGFGAAQFHGYAWFEDAQFHKVAGFGAAQFHGEAGFEAAQFHKVAGFEDAQFHKNISFEDAVFEQSARFTGAKFCEAEGKANFFQATFKRFATFRDAHFFREAQFTAISVERAFDLRGAVFDTLPDFTQANFREAPRLDNLTLTPGKVEPGGFWRPIPGDAGVAGDAVANYRSLRRLAIQSHDHANEQAFLRGEIRAKRGSEDRPWPWQQNSAAYWMGVFYDAFSDFGRSIARPFWLWVMSAAAFAALYLALSKNGLIAPACANGQPGAAVLDALYLAYKNALLVIGWESEQKLNQVHACLYGEAQAPSSIALIQLGQNLLSAAALFLLILGIRNRFKIK